MKETVSRGPSILIARYVVLLAVITLFPFTNVVAEKSKPDSKDGAVVTPVPAAQSNGEGQSHPSDTRIKGDAVAKYLKKVGDWLQEAGKWLQGAANQALAKIQYNTALKYHDGLGVPKDNTKALEWAQKAADLGYAKAQCAVGWVYDQGEGVPKDSKKAMEWYQKAAEQGDADAQFNIGVMYYYGVDIPKDLKKAAECYQKIAEQGNANAQYRLAWMYYQGEGVPKDLKKAVKWFRKAAEQGNADAQVRLGICYANGDGVPKDEVEAVKWFRKAAEQGDANAQGNMGMCYANGRGVPKDDVEAVKWFRKAAEQGNADAQVRLGIRYADGDGVPKDEVEAVKWIRKAADQGDAGAQYGLGLHYRIGQGVPKDDVEAYKWLNLAGQTLKDARELRDKAASEMTPEQIEEAQRRAARFVPKSPQDVVASDKHEEVGFPAAPAQGSNLSEVTGSGTGFFISSDGWLVMNAHVALAGSRVMVKCGDSLQPAKLGPTDKGNDLALLKIEGPHDALPIQSSRTVKLGDTVFTVGFPNPGMQGVAAKMTKGEISSLTGAIDDPRHFQISVPIQPGNSGGALVDTAGNVVGVIRAKLDDAAAIQASGAIPQNVSYAVKSSYLLALAEGVPEVAKALHKVNEKAADFSEVVQTVEAATLMVFVFK